MRTKLPFELSNFGPSSNIGQQRQTSNEREERLFRVILFCSVLLCSTLLCSVRHENRSCLSVPERSKSEQPQLVCYQSRDLSDAIRCLFFSCARRAGSSAQVLAARRALAGTQSSRRTQRSTAEAANSAKAAAALELFKRRPLPLPRPRPAEGTGELPFPAGAIICPTAGPSCQSGLELRQRRRRLND